LKVAILGASGFIGQNLAKKLILDGHEVTSFVREPKPGLRTNLGHEIAFDFSKLVNISESLNSFDTVFHLVSSTNPSKSASSSRFDAQENLMASLDLIEILKDNPATRLVFVSSGGAVYGIPESVPISESHSTNPISFYGVSKLAIEKYLYAYSVSNQLNYVVLRLSNPYGPGQVNSKGQGLIPTIIESALLNKPLSVWGDGSSVRDYLYIDDVVEGLSGAMSHDVRGSLFNLGSGFGTSVLELVAHIEDITGKNITLDFQEQRPFDVPANVLDASLAKSKLSWVPVTELRQGLEEAVRWNEMRFGSNGL
jgi:UDP-glucose 4-epimerase